MILWPEFVKKPSFVVAISLFAGVALAVFVAIMVVDSGESARSSGIQTITSPPPPLQSPRTTQSEDSNSLARWQNRIASADKADFGELMQSALAIEDVDLRNAVLTALVARWTAEDVPGFVSFLNETEVAGKVPVWKLLSPAMEKVLPSLISGAGASPDLRDILHRFVAYSAQTDPAKALVWVRKWMTGDFLSSSLALISKELAKTSPQQAFEVLSTITNPGRRVDAITGIGAVLGADNPQRALMWASNLTETAERPYAMASVLSTLAKKAPQQAASEFEKFQTAMSSAYSAELKADTTQMGDSAAHLAEGDAGDAEVLPSETNPELHVLKNAGVTIAKEWAATSPTAAMQWVDSLPAGSLKTDATRSALGAWAEVNPQDAFVYFNDHPSADPGVASVIFDSWASQHPSEAATAAAGIANQDQRVCAVSGVVTGWLADGADTGPLQAWIDRLSDADTRDAANYKLVDAISVDQPETAWQRALAIKDTDARNEALQSAFASLVERSPEVARNALKAADLPGTDLSALRTMLEAAGP